MDIISRAKAIIPNQNANFNNPDVIRKFFQPLSFPINHDYWTNFRMTTVDYGLRVPGLIDKGALDHYIRYTGLSWVALR